MGMSATIRGIVGYLVSDKPQHDRSFDDTYGTDTAGSVAPSALGIEAADALRDAVQYLPSPAHITRRLLHSLGLTPAQWAFVDFGCGKGRVLLVAAQLGFRRVQGIEISPQLAEIARQNLRAYRGPRASIEHVEVTCGDARRARLPGEDTVFHFYHPFEGEVLRAVLDNIRASVEAHPRRIRVLYLGAFQGALDVLSEFDFLKRLKFVRCIEPKYSWALYSNE